MNASFNENTHRVRRAKSRIIAGDPQISGLPGRVFLAFYFRRQRDPRRDEQRAYGLAVTVVPTEKIVQYACMECEELGARAWLAHRNAPWRKAHGVCIGVAMPAHVPVHQVHQGGIRVELSDNHNG